MTIYHFKKLLENNNIYFKDAAAECGYSKSHFCKILSGNMPTTRLFLNKINEYAIKHSKVVEQIKRPDFIDDFWGQKEMSIPHNNEWQKLKQTELFKQLKNKL